ncbi:MAG TPA: D-TA family PLP-dependent enzyme [Devosia sp.]|jgi:D-serine deaminase-like pyridoxal phosphate-dependent protein|uniref:D-TA family PLP-dependent enzyme n=1 Tax=Devosia sp. TaxID=1871048 RepID=UPI002DDDBCE8|nr:D-TA family PLP-dependent enzyme [Devosia sp.]HEV2518473.1 D-TA family PLP-dependent enzyme [Devosia sp.]
MPTIADLDTPTVLIDIDRVEANLQRAQAHANAHGYALRPHIKTHKLPRFAKRQVELGAVGITAQKLGEAEVMADAGITDIFLPYNILGAKKLARLKALNERLTLSVTADSPDTLFGYAATFTDGKPLTVLIECDSGGGRCGVQTPAQALALARQIALAPGLRFGGLMTYPPLHGVEKSNAWLTEAVALFAEAGIAVPRVSSGNSPDMWAPASAPVTERRPGTYIYYDRFQVKERAASLDDCALSVLVTVVSRPTATRVVIDAGSKSLTSDLLGMEGFGLVMGTDLTIKGLSEEHGVIELPVASDWPRVGERLRIIPNHACVISNLFDSVTLISGDEVREVVPVAARGRVD